MLGVDASTTRDLTALVGCTLPENDIVQVVHCRVWRPTENELRGGKPTVDLNETLGAEMMRLHAEGCVAAIVADPYQLHALLLEWAMAGIKVIELPQNAGRVESDQALYETVAARRILHYGHPVLAEHVENAVAAETPRGFRLAKEKTSRKIDLVVALSMAHWGARQIGARHSWLLS